jgi:hypothetical protein
MPHWAQTVTWVLATLVAVAGVWVKVVRPLAELVVLHRRVEPLLKAMVNRFEGSPEVFSILKEIADQFRTDSGSSLRDAVDKLVTVAHENKVAAEVLAVGVEAVKQLAVLDRADATHRQRQIEELSAKVDKAAKHEVVP